MTKNKKRKQALALLDHNCGQNKKAKRGGGAVGPLEAALKSLERKGGNGKMSHQALYEDVKAFIAAQEAFETATGQPAPLTEAQRKALSVLKLAPPLPNNVGLAPIAGLSPNLDYVSLLTRKCVRVDFQEGGCEQRWSCLVNFQDSARGYDMTFPVPGPKGEAGEIGQDAPLFARKKDAKKHAARACLEWLMANHLMPADGVNVVFSKVKPKPQPGPPKTKAVVTGANATQLNVTQVFTSQVSTPAVNTPQVYVPQVKPITPPLDLPLQVKVEPEDDMASSSAWPALANVALKRDAPDDSSGSSTPGPPSTIPRLSPSGSRPARKAVQLTSGGQLDVNNDDIPATQRVIALCQRLDIPAPRYEIKAVPGPSGYWSGYADLGMAHDMLPIDAGRVDNVYGKRNAKEEIAEQLLRFLKEIQQKRSAVLQELLGPN